MSLSGTGSVATSPLTVNPTSLRFAGQAGSSTLRPASVSITNAGAGSLALTGASDQPWLVLSAAPGEQPLNSPGHRHCLDRETLCGELPDPIKWMALAGNSESRLHPFPTATPLRT